MYSDILCMKSKSQCLDKVKLYTMGSVQITMKDVQLCATTVH